MDTAKFYSCSLWSVAKSGIVVAETRMVFLLSRVVPGRNDRLFPAKRNRLKVNAAIENAKTILVLQKEQKE